jgi:hypothetical protein
MSPSRDTFHYSQDNDLLQPAPLEASPQNIKSVDRGWVGQGNRLNWKIIAGV